VIGLGERLEAFNGQALRRTVIDRVARFRHATLADLQVGTLLLDMNHAMASHGLRPPSELAMLGKTLLTLDQVARCLAPDLDVNAAIREQAGSLMRQRVAGSASSGGVLAAVLEAKQFAEQLPARVNRVLDAAAGNDLRLKVEMIDEGAVIDGLQKVANRIATGLVLAALIVAAALIMQVPTTYRLLGYPGLAMILFVLAATGGALLVLQIVAHDRVRRRTR
jgi:predicted unusual protein kinase regulating ubiquinone biosynthesis (AarF/ABC1/UbiB family)